jgi:hypothetical protein
MCRRGQQGHSDGYYAAKKRKMNFNTTAHAEYNPDKTAEVKRFKAGMYSVEKTL